MILIICTDEIILRDASTSYFQTVRNCLKITCAKSRRINSSRLGIENEGVAELRRVFDDDALTDLDKRDAQVIDRQFLTVKTVIHNYFQLSWRLVRGMKIPKYKNICDSFLTHIIIFVTIQSEGGRT